MKALSELKGILSEQLKWHKSRIDCLAQMLIALIALRTVNLSELAIGMAGKKSQLRSREKRLYRFLANFEFDLLVIGKWIIALFSGKTDTFYLAIDRTNWYWGKTPINILMVLICHEGIAIPIMWEVLKKDGSTSTEEQISMVKKAVELVGLSRIEGLLADREFGNQNLLDYLNKTKIPFYIRIKGDKSVFINGKKLKKASELFKGLKRYSPKVFGMRVQLGKTSVYLTASKNERDELMIIATNRKHKEAVSIYLRRWEIECLFQSLKGRGFRFEETHITKPERIEKMIAVLAIGFAWAHRTGEWLASQKPIRFKQLKTFLTIQQRPVNSFFRYGLDYLRDVITGLSVNWRLLKKSFQLIELAPSGAIL